MTSKAVIVGATGSVGQTLSDYLIKKKYFIFQINRKKKQIKKNKNIKELKFNLKNKKKLINFFNNHSNLEIYFLASKNLSSFQEENKNFLDDNMNANVFGLINCLEAMQLSKNKHKLIYTSSLRVYEAYENKKISEKTQFKYNSYYSLTKDLGMRIIKYYREKYKLFLCIATLCTNYSKYTKKEFLIPKIIDQIKNDKLINIKNFNISLDFLDSKTISMLMHRMCKLKKPEDFIVSSGQKYILHQIINMICQKLKKKNYKKIISKKKYCSNNYGSNKKIKKYLKCKNEVFTLNYIIKNILYG